MATKYRIRQNRWDNWYGYAGTRRVEGFANTAGRSAQQNAEAWLRKMQGAATTDDIAYAEAEALWHLGFNTGISIEG